MGDTWLITKREVVFPPLKSHDQPLLPSSVCMEEFSCHCTTASMHVQKAHRVSRRELSNEKNEKKREKKFSTAPRFLWPSDLIIACQIGVDVGVVGVAGVACDCIH